MMPSAALPATSLTCACPSPRHVFETIEKRYLSSFHSPVFGALQVDFSLADIPRADYEPVDYTLTVVQTSGDLHILSDDGGLVADLVDARREAIASAQREADAKWVVPAADVPKNGAILSGVSKGVTAKLVTAKDAAGYYVRFFRVADLTDENQGDLQASIYITGGKTARINLPAGFYRVLEAYGDTWYGKDYMFGPDGSYQRWNEVFEIEKGYVYTLTFHTENGNMDSTGVTYLD